MVDWLEDNNDEAMLTASNQRVQRKLVKEERAYYQKQRINHGMKRVKSAVSIARYRRGKRTL